MRIYEVPPRDCNLASPELGKLPQALQRLTDRHDTRVGGCQDANLPRHLLYQRAPFTNNRNAFIKITHLRGRLVMPSALGGMLIPNRREFPSITRYIADIATFAKRFYFASETINRLLRSKRR